MATCSRGRAVGRGRGRASGSDRSVLVPVSVQSQRCYCGCKTGGRTGIARDGRVGSSTFPILVFVVRTLFLKRYVWPSTSMCSTSSSIFEKMERPDGTKEHVAAQPPRDGHFSGRRAGFGRGGIGQAGRPAASRGAHPPPFHGAAAEDARRAPRHLAGFNHARSSVRIG